MWSAGRRKGGKVSTRSATALVALRRILKATENNARSLSRVSRLTPSQLIVLQLIEHEGELSPTAIARNVSLTQATVTSLVDRLEAKSLVERRRDSKDGRRIAVRLTANGRKILKTAPDALQERFQKKFEALEDWEQAWIIAALERVSSLLDAESIDASPVLDVGAIE